MYPVFLLNMIKLIINKFEEVKFMGYRIVEISRPAELHINKGILSIEQKEGMANIPIEDIATIVFQGPAIRISTFYWYTSLESI